MTGRKEMKTLCSSYCEPFQKWKIVHVKKVGDMDFVFFFYNISVYFKTGVYKLTSSI